MSVDYNRAATLLHIIDIARQHPSLKAITDLSMAELAKINTTAAKDLEDLRRAEAKRVAEEEAKAQAEREKLAKQRPDEGQLQAAAAKASEPAKPAGQQFTQPKAIPGSTPLTGVASDQDDKSLERKV